MPLRADGMPFRAFRSPGSRIAASVHLPEVSLPQWLVSDGGSSLTVARQLRFHTGFPWCPGKILASDAACGQAEVTRLATHRHREREAVRLQRQLEVGGREARPAS